MPELVAGGPTIPVRLLNELDASKVVFFCGAGISMAPGSDLPSFAGLVEHVYAANHIEPDAVESGALKIEALDKALGLLERTERLGSHALRGTVIARSASLPNDAGADVEAARRILFRDGGQPPAPEDQLPQLEGPGICAARTKRERR